MLVGHFIASLEKSSTILCHLIITIPPRYGTSVQSVKDVAAQGKLKNLRKVVSDVFLGTTEKSHTRDISIFFAREALHLGCFRECHQTTPRGPALSNCYLFEGYFHLIHFYPFLIHFHFYNITDTWFFYFQPKCTDSLLEMNKRMTEEQVWHHSTPSET